MPNAKTRIKNGVTQHLLEFSSGSIVITDENMKQELSLSYLTLKDKDNGILRLPQSTMIVGNGIYNGFYHPDNELKSVYTMFKSQPFNANHGDEINSEVGWLETPQRNGTKYSITPILNLNTPEGKNALAHIQNRMYAGKPAELSVGFWCTVTNEHVKHGDIDKTLPVCRDIEPDHCALVTRGACSPADGAGIGLIKDNKNLIEGKNMEEENHEEENTQEEENEKPENQNADENQEQQDNFITFKDKEDFNDAVHQSFASYFNKEKELDAEEAAKNKLEDRFKELEKQNKELADKFKIIKDTTTKPKRKTLSKSEFMQMEQPKQINALKKASVQYVNHVKQCMQSNQKPFGMFYKEKWSEELGCYMGDIVANQQFGDAYHTYDTAGPDIDTWDTDKLPPEMWAGSIFEDAVTKQKLLKYILRIYDNPRKITVPVKVWQDATWTSTRGRDVRSNADDQDYSAQGIELDPVRYRTMALIYRDSIEEATWSVEADVRESLRIATDLKFNELIYTTLDGTALSSGNYQTAGESLTLTHTANAVDWGTSLTVDNLIDASWNVKTVSKQMYVPDSCILSGGMMSSLLKDSPLLNASERGNATIINTGALESALGMTFEVMGDMPQDSGSTDLGLVFDKKFMWVRNVPHEFEIKPNFNEATDSMEWFVYMKAAFSVGDKEAGAVLYS